MCTSVRVPTDSVPTTQSPKIKGGTIVLWPQGKTCQVRVERGKKREGFDSWIVWRWVWWRVSSTVVNVCPSVRPEWLRDSHVCIKDSAFLQRWASLLVMECDAKWAHSASHSEGGITSEKKELLRSYQEESTTSRLISEVKPLRAWLVLGLETTWEHQVS